MKSQLIASALLVGSLFLTGCASDLLIPLSPFGYFAPGGSGSGSSSISSGIDPITQAGIDADNAATDAQSAQDVRDAAAAASAASANLTVP
jgi:hypothetical protein